jgi:hypothetical protein
MANCTDVSIKMERGRAIERESDRESKAERERDRIIKTTIHCISRK